MQRAKRNDRLDGFRLVAAALVVAIHTSPLTSWNENADFFLTRVLARIAVPFFLMVTGQFVASGCRKETDPRVMRYVKKAALLYGISILLYLPIGIYAGHYKNLSVTAWLRMLLFDGTFYHLWYFPACMTGILLIVLLGKLLNKRQTMAVAVILYLAGLGGDSYYGLTEMVPVLSDAYQLLFSLFSYTRNGIFMAPLFFLFGEWTAERNMDDRRVLWAGLGVSFLAMTEEAFLLRHFKLQRHDSMYLLLPVVMFFLYRLLLTGEKQSAPAAGNRRWAVSAVVLSTWVYILHPAMIVVLRGAAKVSGIGLLTENSFVHYIAVLALSVLAAWIPALFLHRSRKENKRNAAQPDDREPHDRKPDRQKPDPETTFSSGRAWLELDRSALHHNVRMLREKLPDSCRLMPAIKADAYGHGAVYVAKELQKAGVDAFCVACAKEGIRLRRQGIQGMILVLGYTHPEQFAWLEQYHLTQTVIDYAYARQLNEYGKTVHVHIGVDTGMHRIGIRSEQLEQIFAIYEMEHLAVDGLFTHLSASDTMSAEGQSYTKEQSEAFYHLISQIKAHGYPCPAVHLQASYGVLNYPELAGDYARIGIALYGVLSTKEDTCRWSGSLKPVLSFKARIATVRTLYQGESAGYGMQYTAKQDMRIATLAVGYADGLPRALSLGVGSVLIHGHRAPVIGRICMDQTIVDISGIPQVQAGEEAVLIGRCGDMEISVCDIAAQAGTIANEILSRMGSRLERVLV